MTVRWVTWVGPKGHTITAHALDADGRTMCRLRPNVATTRPCVDGVDLPACRRCLWRMKNGGRK